MTCDTCCQLPVTAATHHREMPERPPHPFSISLLSSFFFITPSLPPTLLLFTFLRLRTLSRAPHHQLLFFITENTRRFLQTKTCLDSCFSQRCFVLSLTVSFKGARVLAKAQHRLFTILSRGDWDLVLNCLRSLLTACLQSLLLLLAGQTHLRRRRIRKQKQPETLSCDPLAPEARIHGALTFSAPFPNVLLLLHQLIAPFLWCTGVAGAG